MGKITLDDISLASLRRSARVAALREVYFRAVPEVCIERAQLVTRAHRELGLLTKDRISVLDKARVYRRVLEERTPVVWHTSACEKTGKDLRTFTNFTDESSFAGSTTSKFKGVILYPEFMALALWPELHSITRREANPYQLTQEEADILNREVFPPWMDLTLMERARADSERRARSDPGNDAPDFDLLQQMVFYLASKPNCISHTIPDFRRAVGEGLRAVGDEAQQRAQEAATDAKREFYQAVGEVVEGIVAYSQNLAGKADEMAAAEADDARRQELEEIARIHRQVPELPARNFREGLTAVWICWIAVHQENPNVGLSLGRLDQILGDLYAQDIAAGTLTIDQAIDLVCCLWLKIGDHVPTVPEAAEQLFGGTGSNQAITIGGVDPLGEDAVNDLTYVMLRATELMQLRDPNLNARYMLDVNTPEYLRRLCEANLHTRATPALHNDRAVIEALTSKGDTLEQARDYGVIGCVEPGSNGRHYGHSASILLNLTSALELTLFNGRHRHTGLGRLISVETGDPAAFERFEDFRSALETQVGWLIRKSVDFNNAMGRAHQAYYPTPVLSTLFEGPMESGKDVIEGGAAINSSGVAIIGLADTADSLSAIETVVFDEGVLSLAELLTALQRNFEETPDLQARLANHAKTPKWGNEDPRGNGNAEWIVRMLDGRLSAERNYRGGAYRVGYWSMTNHAGFGRLMGALPSGRKARENFSSGFTPGSAMTPQLTPVLNSVAALPAAALSNGVAFNVKFTPELAGNGAETLDRFVAAVDGYFRGPNGGSGGMEIQFNVIPREDFVEAVEHPEKYPEMLVRVSGYTAYFKDLTPQMQKEIIDRTEYALRTGTATQHGPFQIEG